MPGPGSLTVRRGAVADLPAWLALFDEAVRWLVARGRAGQWGSDPLSATPGFPERLEELVRAGEARVAERGGRVVGALTLGAAPDHAPPADEPELYIQAFVTSRALAGSGVGDALLAAARDEAGQRGARLLRVDCWAGGDGQLVRYYESRGFTATHALTVGTWPATVLARPVP